MPLTEVSIIRSELQAIDAALPTLGGRVETLRYSPDYRRSLLIGFVGEWAAFKWLRGRTAEDVSSWLRAQKHVKHGRDDGGDVLLHGTNGNQSVEVRSRVIGRRPRPRDSFGIAYQRIPPESRDVLLFVCVSSELDRAWLVGWLPREEWLDCSWLIYPGENLGGMRASTLNVAICFRDLKPVEDLIGC